MKEVPQNPILITIDNNESKCNKNCRCRHCYVSRSERQDREKDSSSTTGKTTCSIIFYFSTEREREGEQQLATPIRGMRKKRRHIEDHERCQT